MKKSLVALSVLALSASAFASGAKVGSAMPTTPAPPRAVAEQHTAPTADQAAARKSQGADQAAQRKAADAARASAARPPVTAKPPEPTRTPKTVGAKAK